MQQENSGLEVELSATKSLLKKLDHKGVVRRPISHAIAKKPVVAATRPPMTSHNHTATSAKPKEILTPRSVTELPISFNCLERDMKRSE